MAPGFLVLDARIVLANILDVCTRASLDRSRKDDGLSVTNDMFAARAPLRSWLDSYDGPFSGVDCHAGHRLGHPPSMRLRNTSFSAAEANDCAEYCEESKTCEAFTWEKSTGSCWPLAAPVDFSECEIQEGYDSWFKSEDASKTEDSRWARIVSKTAPRDAHGN